MVASCPKRKCWKRSLQTWDINPQCPGETAVPEGEWGPTAPGMDGISEVREYRVTGMLGSNSAESPCVPFDAGTTGLARMRRLNCPIPFTQWSNTRLRQRRIRCNHYLEVAEVRQGQRGSELSLDRKKVRRQTTRLATAP